MTDMTDIQRREDTTQIEEAKEEKRLKKERMEEEALIEKLSLKTFEPITPEEVIATIGMTIKADETNKLVVFLCQLSAFTEDSQLNISFNAPSASGKSYLAIEVARLFPRKDVVELGYASPSSFFHDTVYNKEKKIHVKDLERKIYIFLDMPHAKLLEHLRPVLSHDKKEILIKISDKAMGGKHRTKNIVMIGYPSVIFCTASNILNEQEITRFLLLSPEITQEKLRQSILERIKKESNLHEYKSWLERDPRRLKLKERILAIKYAAIKNIIIPDNIAEKVSQLFLKNENLLRPRHNRDVGRFMGIIKVFCLLNLWDRRTDDKKTLECNEADFNYAINVWKEINESQKYDISPYLYGIYERIIKPLCEGVGNIGVSRLEIGKNHLKIIGSALTPKKMTEDIMPMLKQAGLIYEEKDERDARKFLIFLTEKPQKEAK